MEETNKLLEDFTSFTAQLLSKFMVIAEARNQKSIAPALRRQIAEYFPFTQMESIKLLFDNTRCYASVILCCWFIDNGFGYLLEAVLPGSEYRVLKYPGNRNYVPLNEHRQQKETVVDEAVKEFVQLLNEASKKYPGVIDPDFRPTEKMTELFANK